MRRIVSYGRRKTGTRGQKTPMFIFVTENVRLSVEIERPNNREYLMILFVRFQNTYQQRYGYELIITCVSHWP